MKRIAGVLCVASIVALVWLRPLWIQLEGQVQAQLTVQPNDEALSEACREWSADSLECGLYAMGEGTADGLEGILLYECLVYHPDALGVTVVAGTSVTPAQIAAEDRVVMLSEATALALDPSMNCVGREIAIGGEYFRIVGIYRMRSPLGVLTQRPEASAILPCRMSDEPRSMYLWLRTQGNSRFLLQRTSREIEGLTQSPDFGGAGAQDAGTAAAHGRQRILFWLWLDGVVAAAARLWQWKSRRARFAREVIRRRGIFEGRSFLRKAVALAATDLLPSAALAFAAILATACAASGLALDETIVPLRFLDPGTWLEMFKANALRANTSDLAPVYPIVLGARLTQLTEMAGTLSFGSLLLSLRRERCT